MNNPSLKNRVMLRIYLMYTKNLFVERFDYFMIGTFIVTSLMMISAQDVIHNMPMDSWSSFFNFIFVAVRDTSLIIQAFIVGFIVRAIVGSAKITYKNVLPRISAIHFRY